MLTDTANPAATYDATAPVYDVLTAHHRYDVWTDMLERLLQPHGLPPRGRLLDVGCGTGKSFLPWEARGWEVVACDASLEMLRRAAAKAGPPTRIAVADARELGDFGSFELVTMTDDVVNYLAPDELVASFAGVARNLAPHGLFAFDANTLLTYRTFFADTDVRESDAAFAVWRGSASTIFAAGDVATATLVGFVRDEFGCWTRNAAIHRQHHHPIDRLATALAKAGLSLIDVCGVDDDAKDHRPVDETRQHKAVLIARRITP